MVKSVGQRKKSLGVAMGGMEENKGILLIFMAGICYYWENIGNHCHFKSIDTRKQPSVTG